LIFDLRSVKAAHKTGVLFVRLGPATISGVQRLRAHMLHAALVFIAVDNVIQNKIRTNWIETSRATINTIRRPSQHTYTSQIQQHAWSKILCASLCGSAAPKRDVTRNISHPALCASSSADLFQYLRVRHFQRTGTTVGDAQKVPANRPANSPVLPKTKAAAKDKKITRKQI
jgi:hypothetical protein